jgi:hypothetical protein
MNKFYIYDCLGLVCGNHSGYTSMKGALIGLSKIKDKMYVRLDVIRESDVKYKNCTTVWSINQGLSFS